MNVDTPDPRNYGQETADTLAAQVKLAPDQYAANAKYSPLYTGLNTSNTNLALFGQDGQSGLLASLQRAAPQLQDITSGTASQGRQADLADLEKYGAQTVAAIKGADPQQLALSNALNAKALEGLDAGYGVDPALAAQIQQQLRASQGARGLGFGQPDAVAEAYAVGDRGLLLNQQRQQFGLDTARFNAGSAVDPTLALLGRPSNALGASQGFLQQGQGSTVGNLFNPESAYAADVNNTNYNASAASKIAGANNTAGIVGAGLGAL